MFNVVVCATGSYGYLSQAFMLSTSCFWKFVCCCFSLISLQVPSSELGYVRKTPLHQLHPLESSILRLAWCMVFNNYYRCRRDYSNLVEVVLRTTSTRVGSPGRTAYPGHFPLHGRTIHTRGWTTIPERTIDTVHSACSPSIYILL